MKIAKKSLIIKGITLLMAVVMYIGAVYYANHDRPGYFRHVESRMTFETARVLRVLEDRTVIDETTEGIRRGTMILQIEILSGEHQGRIGEVPNHFSGLFNVDVSAGDRISVRVEDIDEINFNVLIHNYERSRLLIGSIVAFLLILSFIGGKQGMKAIVGLIFTVITIIFLLIPLMLKGFPTIPTTVAILTLTSMVSLILLGGISSKTISAIIGCLSGVICAAILASAVGYFAGISGFNMDETESLLAITFDADLQIRGLFISGVLIASLGAVLDISVSVASAVEEVKVANPELTAKQLFKSGMNVGRAAMGATANTLILAFAGTSLNMMIIIFAYGISFNQLINTDFIAVELIRSLAGSLGLVLTVPVVAYFAAKLMTDWNIEKSKILKFLTS